MEYSRFLFAQLHMEELRNKMTVKEVKTTLSHFSSDPTALDKAYARILKNMDHHPLARKNLSWITFAIRPLSTAELRCALAVERGATEIDPENIPEVEDLVAVCDGFVVHDQERDVVRLRHYTTQKYLENVSVTWDPTPQLLITTTCIDYLSLDAFKGGDCNKDGIQTILEAN
jgi:hypothetical protein